MKKAPSMRIGLFQQSMGSQHHFTSSAPLRALILDLVLDQTFAGVTTRKQLYTLVKYYCLLPAEHSDDARFCNIPVNASFV
jgi:hypothetical protein